MNSGWVKQAVRTRAACGPACNEARRQHQFPSRMHGGRNRELLGMRGGATHGREAGGDLNVDAARQDEHRVEVIANGLELWGGALLAVDTTLVSFSMVAGPQRQGAQAGGGHVVEQGVQRRAVAGFRLQEAHPRAAQCRAGDGLLHRHGRHCCFSRTCLAAPKTRRGAYLVLRRRSCHITGEAPGGCPTPEAASARQQGLRANPALLRRRCTRQRAGAQANTLRRHAVRRRRAAPTSGLPLPHALPPAWPPVRPRHGALRASGATFAPG